MLLQAKKEFSKNVKFLQRINAHILINRRRNISTIKIFHSPTNQKNIRKNFIVHFHFIPSFFVHNSLQKILAGKFCSTH